MIRGEIKMKKKWEPAEIEVICLSVTDIICTSPVTDFGDEDLGEGD